MAYKRCAVIGSANRKPVPRGTGQLYILRKRMVNPMLIRIEWRNANLIEKKE
ncbi:MAG: hypothetical protein JWR23_1596 [Mucilaginibacter sp.]|nr:hypothetical protein [Mucilaginibacter sp.]